jgi:hypothetical protein
MSPFRNHLVGKALGTPFCGQLSGHCFMIRGDVCAKEKVQELAHELSTGIPVLK